MMSMPMTNPTVLAAQGQSTHHHHFHHQHHPHHHHLFHHHTQQQLQQTQLQQQQQFQQQQLVQQQLGSMQAGLLNQQPLVNQPPAVNVNEDYHHHHHLHHRHHHHHLFHHSKDSSSTSNNAILSVVPPPADVEEFDDYSANMAVYGCYNPQPNMMGATTASSNYANNYSSPAANYNNNYSNQLFPQVNATMRNFNTYNGRLENMIASTSSLPSPAVTPVATRSTSTPTSTSTPLCPHDRVYTTCQECSRFSANDISVMREIINMGFPHNDVVSAVKHMKANGTAISLEPLADTVLLLANSSLPPSSSSSTTVIPPPSTRSSSSSSLSASSLSMASSSSAIPVDRQQVEQENGGLCLICCADPINCVVIPCGHIGMCMTCAKKEQARTGKCPVCRSRVVTVVKTFTCN